MALVTVSRPQTEAELAISLAILEAHGIDSFVHGQYFGSLLPGLQIESYNARSIMVSEERAEEAREVLAEATEETVMTASVRLRDKLRVVLETVLFGWFVPGSRR